MKKKHFLLGYSLFIYITFFVCVITLLPFRFQWPERIEIVFWWSWFDFFTNVILFTPLGFLFRLSQRKEAGKKRIFALVFGFLASLSIEIAQLFQIGRYSSPWDILANSLGALVGIQFYDYIKSRLNQNIVGRLALEMPLMILFYLLAPLLWLNGLAAGDDSSHLYLSLILGFFGGSILFSVWIYHLKITRKISSNFLAGTAGTWYLCASFPGFLKNSFFILSCAIGITFFVRILVALLKFTPKNERRFELPVLKWIWPIYATYLLLLALWPWTMQTLSWRGGLGFLEIENTPGIVPTLRILEYLSAFTLLGYLIAESRGRKDEPLGNVMLWIMLSCLTVGISLELIRGFHPNHIASFLQLILSIGVGLYGGLIYRLQLNAFQKYREKQA